MFKPTKVHLQPHDRSQQTDNTEAMPMPELTPEELLNINGGGVKRGFIRTDMFVL